MWMFLLWTLTSGMAGAEVPALMKDVVSLRSELETLGREVEAEQKEKLAELDLWTQKKLELEGALQKETLRRLQLHEKTARLEQRVKSESKTDPLAKREFLNWIGRAEAWVKESLPFRRDSRLEALVALRARVEGGKESLESLAAELWMFYEGEIKMAGDNEFRIVDLGLSPNGGKAEVARLGWYTMFARDAGGAIRQAVFRDGGWHLEPVTQTAEAVRLIDNLKAKKDSGLYEVPRVGPKESL